MFILAVVAIAGFFASRLDVQEDLSKVMPSDEKINKMNLVFRNSKFADKMVFNIYLSDSTIAADPDKLVDFCEEMVEGLSSLQPDYISEINHKVSDEMMGEVYNTFYENIPFFLDENDYKKIEENIQRENLDSAFARNYKTLMSPASVVLKQFIVKDPVGISFLGLKKLQDLQVEDNYELYNGYVMTKDHRNLLFFISPAHSNNETAANGVMIDKMEGLIDSLSTLHKGEVNADYFGAVAMSAANAKRIKSDLALTVTIAILILVVFISMFFRRAEIVFLIFLPVIIGGLISLAIVYFIKPDVSAIALGMGSVLLGITIDYSLHIFTHFKSTGSAKSVIKDLTTPLLLSSLITASSFGCLMFVKSEALQDLGLFAGISVVNAVLIGLIVLPHLLKRKANEQNTGHVPHAGGLSFIYKYTSYRFDKNKYLIAAIVIITFVCSYTYKNVTFETDMLKMNYVSEKLYNAQKNLDKISTISLKSVYLISSSDNLEDALAKNEALMPQINALKEKGVVKSFSTATPLLLTKAEQKRRIDRWNAFWTPEKISKLKADINDIAPKYKFRTEAFGSFYTFLTKNYEVVSLEAMENLKKLFLNDFVTENKEMSTIVTLLKVEEEDKPQVYSSFTESANLTILDKKYLTDKFISILNEDFNMLEVMSLLLVLVILIISYGRIELGLISFLPMCLSWLWTLGLMGIFGIKFNIINIIISTFILGLGIDYSIFIMSGLLEEYKTNAEHLNSYKTSIFLSAFTSIVGIGVLILAEHPALKSIAFLSIIGMFSVILISYTVQPLLFRGLITNRIKKGKYPYTAATLFFTIFAYSYFLLGCIILNLFFPVLLYLVPLNKRRKKYVLNFMIMCFTRSMIYIMANVKKVIINKEKEDFKKPAVIIANHSSFLDILLTLMLYPKLLIVTNDWVWNSPFFGRVVQMAGFIRAGGEAPPEERLKELEEAVKDGYSIIIFPEGTRSVDGKIGRFHKGAFLMAEKLNIDILPILIHGAGEAISKGDLQLKNTTISMKILPRIKPEDTRFGSSYSERTKQISKYFKAEYAALRNELETPEFFLDRLYKNYLYKGPVLEWYMRIKLRLEDNYRWFDQVIPKTASVTDLGCGYGFLPYMLSFLGENRKITGIDYDDEKIQVAQNCFSRTGNVKFDCGDITCINLEKSDVFVISDVLHYLTPAQQDLVIKNAAENVNEGGMVIIRDGDKDSGKKHEGTKLTEFFSTKFLKFNKTQNPLYFMSGEQIISAGKKLGLDAEVIDNTKFTSNKFYILRKPKTEILIPETNGQI